MGRLIQWGKYVLSCQVMDYSKNNVPMRMVNVGWYFLISKYVEFLDTVSVFYYFLYSLKLANGYLTFWNILKYFSIINWLFSAKLNSNLIKVFNVPWIKCTCTTKADQKKIAAYLFTTQANCLKNVIKATFDWFR